MVDRKSIKDLNENQLLSRSHPAREIHTRAHRYREVPNYYTLWNSRMGLSIGPFGRLEPVQNPTHALCDNLSASKLSQSVSFLGNMLPRMHVYGKVSHYRILPYICCYLVRIYVLCREHDRSLTNPKLKLKLKLKLKPLAQQISEISRGHIQQLQSSKLTITFRFRPSQKVV